MIGEGWNTPVTFPVTGGPLSGSSGAMSFTVPADYAGPLVYYCIFHSDMVRTLAVIDCGPPPPGSHYCTHVPDETCYLSGWPSCCANGANTCPQEKPGCDVAGSHYCTHAPDEACYATGWPSCCTGADAPAQTCPTVKPSCELNLLAVAQGAVPSGCSLDSSELKGDLTEFEFDCAGGEWEVEVYHNGVLHETEQMVGRDAVPQNVLDAFDATNVAGCSVEVKLENEYAQHSGDNGELKETKYEFEDCDGGMEVKVWTLPLEDPLEVDIG